jgi:hypothetical protein
MNGKFKRFNGNQFSIDNKLWEVEVANRYCDEIKVIAINLKDMKTSLM